MAAWLLATGMSSGSLVLGYYIIMNWSSSKTHDQANSQNSTQIKDSGNQADAVENTAIPQTSVPPNSVNHEPEVSGAALSISDGAGDLENPHNQPKQHESNAELYNQIPHWSYLRHSLDGPSHWSDLSEKFSTCGKGNQQSPIDIQDVVFSQSAPQLSFNYENAKIELENSGHTILGRPVNGRHFIRIDGQEYELAQFHFHSPSEHALAGAPSDIELHFVHRNAVGELAVVAVLINEHSGQENSSFKSLWKILPRTRHTGSISREQIQLNALLPKHSSSAHYVGSLTTPPCLEGVKWFVMTSPTTMSSGQIEAYDSIFQGPTNRPRQPMKGRQVVTNSPPGLSH